MPRLPVVSGGRAAKAFEHAAGELAGNGEATSCS